jgi:lysozyme family protein
MGSVCGIQNMLITRYKARISADGKFGAETCGAILAAVKKYGEKHVYNSLYAYRYAFLSGFTLPQNGKCKNNSCSRPICKTLITTRLNKYYPVSSNESIENLMLPVSDEGISRMDVLAYMTTSTLREATNTDSNHQKKYLFVAVGIAAIVGGCLFLAVKTIWK